MSVRQKTTVSSTEILQRFKKIIIQFIDDNSNENQQMQDVITAININKGNGNRR